MCLNCYGKDCSERIAEVGIPVFKVMAERRGLFGIKRYRTPYQENFVSRSVIRGLKDYEACGDEDVQDTCYGYKKEIRGGFIHTFGDTPGNGFMFPQLKRREKYVVFKCVIPKGTRYWHDSTTNAYASKSIRFCEEVEDVRFEKNVYGFYRIIQNE